MSRVDLSLNAFLVLLITWMADDSVYYKWEICADQFVFEFITTPRNIVSLVKIKFAVVKFRFSQIMVAMYSP